PLGHSRQSVLVLSAMARVEADPVTVLDDLEAKAVPFRLVDPILAFGRANGRRRRQGVDERETRVEDWHARDLANSFVRCKIAGRSTDAGVSSRIFEGSATIAAGKADMIRALVRRSLPHYVLLRRAKRMKTNASIPSACGIFAVVLWACCPG